MPTENQERAFTEPFDPITVGRLLFWRIPNVQVCIRVLRWKCEGTSPIKRSLNTQNASFHFLNVANALLWFLHSQTEPASLRSSHPPSLHSFLPSWQETDKTLLAHIRNSCASKPPPPTFRVTFRMENRRGSCQTLSIPWSRENSSKSRWKGYCVWQGGPTEIYPGNWNIMYAVWEMSC